MAIRPKCIIVTGRPGSGKTTLAKLLGKRVWLPVISRDEIKEGYVNTFGIKHDEFPATTNAVVSDFFFEVVCSYLSNNVSIVIEAAFQGSVWEPQVRRISGLGSPYIIVCSLDSDEAARRHLERGIIEPKREFYHSDKRVTLFKTTAAIPPPASYEPPNLNVPTIQVSTDGVYSPGLDQIIATLGLDSQEQAI